MAAFAAVIWLCCHAGLSHLRPATYQALLTFGDKDQVSFVYVGDDDHAYGQALAEAWNCGDDLAIVEPDIVIREDVAEVFHTCDHGYCAFPYAITTDVMPALGCTRFRSGFMAANLDAMERALLEPGGYGAGHYRSVDVGLQRYVLARSGIQPHVHLPAVEHLNELQALIPAASPVPLTEIPKW